MKKRTATITRKTKETNIKIALNIDGSGKTKINTGIGILDHMLELFAFHGLFDLEITAQGDLDKVDIHHTNEDIGIVLGQAFKKALDDKKGIRRFGSVSVPMEGVVANVMVDISGRGFCKFEWTKLSVAIKKQNGYSFFSNTEHFLDSFAKNLGMNLNVKVESPTSDLHTNLEPIFKI